MWIHSHSPYTRSSNTPQNETKITKYLQITSDQHEPSAWRSAAVNGLRLVYFVQIPLCMNEYLPRRVAGSLSGTQLGNDPVARHDYKTEDCDEVKEVFHF